MCGWQEIIVSGGEKEVMEAVTEHCRECRLDLTVCTFPDQYAQDTGEKQMVKHCCQKQRQSSAVQGNPLT